VSVTDSGVARLVSLASLCSICSSLSLSGLCRAHAGGVAAGLHACGGAQGQRFGVHGRDAGPRAAVQRVPAAHRRHQLALSRATKAEVFALLRGPPLPQQGLVAGLHCRVRSFALALSRHMPDTVPPASDRAGILCGLGMTCWLRQAQKVTSMYCQTLSGCVAAPRLGVHYRLYS